METPSSLTPQAPQVALPKTTAHHSRHIVYGVLLGAIAVMMTVVGMRMSWMDQLGSGSEDDDTFNTQSVCTVGSPCDGNNDCDACSQGTCSGISSQNPTLPCSVIGNATQCQSNGCNWNATPICLFCDAPPPPPTCTVGSPCDGNNDCDACSQGTCSGISSQNPTLPCSVIGNATQCQSNGCNWNATPICLFCDAPPPPPTCTVGAPCDGNNDCDACSQGTCSGISSQNPTLPCSVIGNATQCQSNGCNWNTTPICLFCDALPPTYTWKSEGRSKCDKLCGGGTQIEIYGCYDGMTEVAESYCTQPKPTNTQSCNTQPCTYTCSGSQPANTIACSAPAPNNTTTPWIYDYTCLETTVPCTFDCKPGYQRNATLQKCELTVTWNTYEYMCTANKTWTALGTSCPSANVDTSASYYTNDIVCSTLSPKNVPCLGDRPTKQCTNPIQNISIQKAVDTDSWRLYGTVQNAKQVIMKYTAPSGLKSITVPVVNNTFDYTIIFEPGSNSLVTLEFIPTDILCDTEYRDIDCSQPGTPKNGTEYLCTNSDWNLTAESCDTNSTNQFTPTKGYSDGERVCVANTSSLPADADEYCEPLCSPPGFDQANTQVCGNHSNLIKDTDSKLVSTCDNVSAKCQYTCTTGYEPNADRTSCIKIPSGSAYKDMLCASDGTWKPTTAGSVCKPELYPETYEPTGTYWTDDTICIRSDKTPDDRLCNPSCSAATHFDVRINTPESDRKSTTAIQFDILAMNQNFQGSYYAAKDTLWIEIYDQNGLLLDAGTKYMLKERGDIPYTNPGSILIGEQSAKSYILSNLNVGRYTIKVRDTRCDISGETTLEIQSGGTGPSPTRYRCDSGTKQCVIDLNGQYADETSCRLNCGSTPPPPSDICTNGEGLAKCRAMCAASINPIDSLLPGDSNCVAMCMCKDLGCKNYCDTGGTICTKESPEYRAVVTECTQNTTNDIELQACICKYMQGKYGCTNFCDRTPPTQCTPNTTTSCEIVINATTCKGSKTCSASGMRNVCQPIDTSCGKTPPSGPQCTGAIPAYAALCTNDDQGLSTDVARILVNSCTDTRKCEYSCMSGYVYDGATKTCVSSNYSGTPPIGGPVPPQTPRPAPIDPGSPNRRIVDNIKRMIQILSDNCDYADKDYYQILQKYKDVRGKQDPRDPAVILTTYCITNGYRRMLQQQFNSDAFASVYEAIKILSKIHAIGSGTRFDEKAPARPQVPYRDVARGRYTDYVNYAYDAGILDGVVRGSDLKGFTPLQTTQLETMLINAGKDTTPYSAFFRKANIRRDTMAEIFVDIYAEKFVYIEYMMGENIRFYELLLKQLQGLSATQQETYIKNLIQRMKSRDRGQLETKLNIYVDGVIKFLEQEVLR